MKITSRDRNWFVGPRIVPPDDVVLPEGKEITVPCDRPDCESHRAILAQVRKALADTEKSRRVTRMENKGMKWLSLVLLLSLMWVLLDRFPQ